jgi:hypothetical protein
MANLTGTMSSVMGVNLDTEAATKYSEMVTAFAAGEMPLLYGYVSEWDWYAEMAPCAIVEESKVEEYEKIKVLIAKPDPTEDDRTTINNFMNRISKFDMAKHPNASKAWAAFDTYALEWPSPFFKGSGLSRVYGWPNVQSYDPRRTGKTIVFKDVSTSLEWLIQNSYKYGFVWYGPTDETFVYVGQSATFSADFIAAASMGLAAPVYNIYKQANSKAPTSKQDIADWVSKLPATGYAIGGGVIPKDKLANSWIGWDLYMTKAA